VGGNLNLGARILRAGGKTAAGTHREIHLVFDVLIDVLSEHLAAASGAPDSHLFASAADTRLGADNVRRMLDETVETANAPTTCSARPCCGPPDRPHPTRPTSRSRRRGPNDRRLQLPSVRAATPTLP